LTTTPEQVWPISLERELLADACCQHFWPFLRYAYGVSNSPPPNGVKFTADLHKPLCDWLEETIYEWEAMRRGETPMRRFYVMLDAARGSGKSVVGKALILWLSLRHPDLVSVIDCATVADAIEFAGTVKVIYEDKDPYALFTWLFGNWKGTEPWTKARFTHAARRINRSEASIDTTGVEVGITGKHPDFLWLDDPITIDKLREEGNWIEVANTHVIGLFPALLNDSLMFVCATPYCDGDVVSNAITQDGIRKHFGYELPPEYSFHVGPKGKWDLYYMPAAREDGVTLMPQFWPQAELDDYNRKSPTNYAAQCLLRPGSSDLVPLTMEQIQSIIIGKEALPKNLTYTIHMDTAFKDPDRAGRGDETVVQVWGHQADSGNVYFIEGYGSNKWRIEDLIEKLVELTQRYRRWPKRLRWMTDEIGVGGKAGVWLAHLRTCFADHDMHLPPFLEIRRPPNKKKVTRIIEAAGYWIDGHVFLLRDAPGLRPLMWQMARIGISAHDDWADAAADVFHPQIYRPYRGHDGDAPPPPRQPGDEILKPGAMDDNDLRGLYDSYRGDYDSYRGEETWR
jgi:hypothetical protein